MANLPSTERILLGPGPSQMPSRVIRAMASPMLSHLDPEFVPLMDEVRAGLHTGEVELRGEDVAGIAVHVGAASAPWRARPSSAVDCSSCWVC